MISTASPALPRVTVLVPCRNEVRYVGPCLESILATTYPRDRLEILVVDGRSTDGTRDAVQRCAAQHPQVRLLDNPRGIVPAALNLGIRAATGEVIARMDAHCEYPPTYLLRLVTALMETGADNVGGCVATLPPDPSSTARALAIAQAHPLGVGNSRFRIGTSKPRWVDTVPFGCYRREVFQRVGLFDEELVRNQDDEFNHRLLRQGGRVLLVPSVAARYYARGTFRQTARMYYQYGYYKPLVARKLGRIMTLRQLAPAALLLALAGGALVALFWTPAALLTLGLAGSYTACALGAALGAVASHGSRVALALAAAFPVLHASYGVGFLRGVWSVLVPRRRFDVTAVPMSR
ncbi:MAG TPA: glycosyltransferase family 2 protein [Gemmatimonadales bacterium]